MIKKIYVDGFKSLSRFNLDFRSGLNVLVGPNGSGKTNIVSFFEFLSNLIEYEVAEAMSRSGGAGSIFRRFGTRYATDIEVNVEGTIDSISRNIHARRISSESKTIEYSYNFKISLTENIETISYKYQRLLYRKYSSDTKQKSLFSSSDRPWDADITIKKGENDSTQVEIKSFNADEIPYFIHSVADNNIDKEKATERLKEYLLYFNETNYSLISVMNRIDNDLKAVASDLRSGRIFNISPSMAKKSEDVATKPNISKDGSGLSATLYALKKAEDKHKSITTEDAKPSSLRRPRNTSFEELLEYLKLANRDICDIKVENDYFDNKIRVSMQMKGETYDTLVPLHLLSDGTLKWLALMTAALTAGTVFSIEEPENYLHPQMQSQFVSIFRKLLPRKEKKGFALITTHSETILNNCHSHEIIIIQMQDGVTIAKRIEDPKAISDEIKRTGFGLGYYYLSGVLND